MIKGAGDGAWMELALDSMQAVWATAQAIAASIADIGGAGLGLGEKKHKACQHCLKSPVPPKRGWGKPRPCPPCFQLLHQTQGYYLRGSQY